MLPLHIAIKKHVEPTVLNTLLAAFPESIDVSWDHKTPLQMAQSSSSIHKKYYLQALNKGSALHSTIVADPLSDFLCGIDYKSVLDRSPFVLLQKS